MSNLVEIPVSITPPCRGPYILDSLEGEVTSISLEFGLTFPPFPISFSLLHHPVKAAEISWPVNITTLEFRWLVLISTVTLPRIDIMLLEELFVSSEPPLDLCLFKLSGIANRVFVHFESHSKSKN